MGAPAPNTAGTLMQSWLAKWSEWEIQAVVVVSFGLQVILFFFAGIRRYSVSSVLKVFLWFVYLLADTAAIYALGHMSASLSKTSTEKHQLVPLWAAFLLLHLGGQDTITAYALEDNELWLRHLLNMFVQVAGTGYVLHKYIIADRATIVSAAVLVSVAGFLKYGERIWALMCASKNSDKRYMYRPRIPKKLAATNWFGRNGKFRTYELIVTIAHNYRDSYVKPEIRGTCDFPPRIVTDYIADYVDGLDDREDVPAPREKRYVVEACRLIEVQLAVVYDMLYTKAQVIHTWYGYLFRVISSVSCFCVLVAFTRSERDGYSTPDSAITFILVGGACVLEVASTFKVIGSTWTYVVLRGYGWEWVPTAILFARYHLLLVKEGRWSNSIGQYDFVSSSSCGKINLKGRMAVRIGLQAWWIKAHYTKHAKLSPALKEFVCDLIRGEKNGMVQIKNVAVQRGYWACRLTGFDHCEEFDSNLRSDFRCCVYSWHIATSNFLSDPSVKSELVDTGMAEAVTTLSHYMMFLLIHHPDILPMNAAAHNLLQKARECFQGAKGEWMSGDFGDERSRWIYDAHPGRAAVEEAGFLTRKLLSIELGLTHKLVIIGRVWTEMLCYAATNTSGDFHARQLSNGGEFLTHIMLLANYIPGMLIENRTPKDVPRPDMSLFVNGEVVLNVDEISLNIPDDP